MGSSSVSEGWSHSWSRRSAHDPSAPSSLQSPSTRGLSPARLPSSARSREAVPEQIIKTSCALWPLSKLAANRTDSGVTNLNGAAYDPIVFIDLQQILKEPVLFFLVSVVSGFFQVDGFNHGSTEIHHGIASVSPLQRFIAASEPGHKTKHNCDYNSAVEPVDLHLVVINSNTVLTQLCQRRSAPA